MNVPAFAAIDIGSNSVLLLAGGFGPAGLDIQVQRKQTVRLGGGLDASGQLRPDAMERGWECLRRYAGLIDHIRPEHRCAVATQTLREATNREQFLQEASRILSCPVQLITGEQEAQGIYQGVSALLPNHHEQRLVIDIGGRSTEICTGLDRQLQTAHSVAVGSVAWAQRFFASGTLGAEAFAAAQTQAHALLAPIHAQLQSQPLQWQQIYGSSGTAGAISKALQQMGHPAGSISRQGLLQLRQQLIHMGHIDRLPLQGMREDIKPVIGGGVSIMCAVFEVFGIEHMRIAQGALRHGLLLQMHERHQQGLAY